MNPRSLIIEPVLNGFVVQAGCQRVVFDSAAKLGAHITEYYANPAKVESEFLKNKVNDTMSQPAMPEPAREDRVLRREPIAVPRGPETECAGQACEPVVRNR